MIFRSIVALALLLVGCGRNSPTPPVAANRPSDDRLIPIEDPVSLPSGMFASLYPDPAEAEFRAEFAGLLRLGPGDGLVLYAPGALEVVDKLRSEFPKGHPLWVDTVDAWMDARVLARLPAASLFGRARYLLHSYGGSGDPMYFMLAEDGSDVGNSVDGDLLVIPAGDTAWMYQRTNSMYSKRKRIVIDDEGVREIQARKYPIGLSTVAFGDVRLRRAIDDSTIVATVPAGDSLLVVEADDIAENTTPAFLIRSSSGAQGWVRISTAQCNMGLIKGLCFLGD
jgi:hypothetical protein